MDLVRLLEHALEEDVVTNDVTTTLFYDAKDTLQARVIAKEKGVFFGQEIIETLFQIRGNDVEVKMLKKDAEAIAKGDSIALFSGSAITLLTTERVMLNFLQHLSGVATQTQKMVSELNDANIKLLDTRKTTPLYRILEKQAVRAGGGVNHRFSLSDMVLIKENHLTNFLKKKTFSDLSDLLKKVKKTHNNINIEIEINQPALIESLDFSSIDVVMLDHFSLDQTYKASHRLRERGFEGDIEVSGNITLKTISRYNGAPINRISVGALTHSVTALDMTLLTDD